MPSFRRSVESAHQFSSYGSGAGSRWTWATASSISGRPRCARRRVARRPVHFWRSRNSSATFRQSRPSGRIFQFRINVTGVVMFAVAAKPQQIGDDQLRAAAARAGRRRRRRFQARGQIRAVHGLRLRRRSRRPCRPDRAQANWREVGVE